MPEQMTNVAVLRRYFYREGKDSLKTFMDEVKALSAEERAELGQAAAKALGIEIVAS